MTQETHDYALALDSMPTVLSAKQDGLIIWYLQNHRRVRKALKIAQKLAQDPSEDMWGGLARAIIMGRDMNCNTRSKMLEHLKMSGQENIPECVLRELEGEKHMAKGDVAVCVFTAMRDQLYKEIE